MHHTFLTRLGLRIVLAALVAGVWGCSSAPPKPTVLAQGDYRYTIDYLSWLIEREMKRNEVAGLSIALIDDQRLVWSKGFGFADRERRAPATPEMVYRVASISKLFTATAAMQLVEDGRLDLDEPVKTYLPGFSIKSRFDNPAAITPRSILTHHSGLPQDRLKGRFVRNAVPFARLAEEIRDDYTAYPPNHVFKYSNLAYAILGAIVERVSGRDFAGYADEKILRPIGMNQSSFRLTPEIQSALAQGYVADRAVAAEALPVRNLPASGLYSNVRDLARFIQMIFAEGQAQGARVLAPETIAEMLQPQNSGVPLDVGVQMGLGWFLGGSAGPYAERTASHAGGMVFFYSQLLILPAQKLGVIVLSNSASADHVVFDVASTAIGLALEAKSGTAQPAAAASPPSANLARDLPLASYEGRYWTVGGFAKITERRGELVAEMEDRKIYLLPEGEGWFRPVVKILGIFRKSITDGAVGFARLADRDVVIFRQGRELHRIGEKLPPASVPPKWKERLGRYEILNQDDFLEIQGLRLSEQEGTLWFEGEAYLPGIPTPVQKERLLLIPVSDREAIIAGPGFGAGETVAMDDVEGEYRLQYSGYDARRVSD